MIEKGYCHSNLSTRAEAVTVKAAPLLGDEILITGIDGGGWKVSFNVIPIKVSILTICMECACQVLSQIHRRDIDLEALCRPDYPPRFSVFLDKQSQINNTPPQVCIQGLGDDFFFRVLNEGKIN